MNAPDWSRLHRVLVMRLDNIGDVILTGPALRALREAAPRARLTLMASPAGAQAAALLPWIDEVLVWRVLWQDLGRLPFDPAREEELLRVLREGQYDAAVILTSFSQSPHPAALLCALAGIPVRLGESKERGGALTFAPPGAPDALHQAERNLRLLECAGVPVRDRALEVRVPAEAHTAARALLASRGVSGPYVLLNPWTSCEARTYPPLRFARAARLLADRADLPVVLTGAPKDAERAAPLLDALGARGVSTLGETGLPEFAALLGGAALVLTNNTSALHLADALGTPVLCTYSGTELESQWTPRRAPHRLLRRDTACSPCYAFSCPFELECLDFSPEDVAAAGWALLSELEAVPS